MPQYLLSIYQPDGGPPPPDVLEAVMRDVTALTQEMESTGALVLTLGLTPPDTATVVQVREGSVLATDGPYIETKEHIGGFWILEAADLDTAREWAGKAARATTLPIEVREVQQAPD